MNCMSTIAENLKSLELTHGNHLKFLFPVLTFYEIFYPTPSTDFPLYSQKQKRDLKHYERDIFPASITQEGITQIHNGGPKYRIFSCIYDILNSFANTQSAH